MIPDEIVERVREEADIVSIVGEFVKLKRVGNTFRGPCPFHHGKNDNFAVMASGGYTCFRCGEKGDVFTFVQKHLGLDFVEAVKWVGGRAGVEVREVAKRTEERDAREPFWEVNGALVDFFQRRLWESPDGKAARDYLASRSISRDDAERFSIGYAPRDRDAMRDALAALGFDEQRQLEAKLLVTSDDRPEPRPRFRDRLMFPIFDASGRPVGFGGRVLGSGEPKYLNSAESPVFLKGSLLYGLNWAKQSIRKVDRLIVVEGYFDAIRLALAGIAEVVAPLGTALRPEQAMLIQKYTKNVFLLYDSDQAGLKATFSAGDTLVANGLAVRVISLPDGDDPDTFVAKAGADGFERAAAASVDIFDRKIQILERGGWFADLRRRRQAIDRLVPTIRATADRVMRDLYISRTSEVSGVPRETLMAELDATPRQRRGPPEPHGPPPDAPDFAEAKPVRATERRPKRQGSGTRAERELVRMLLHQRRYVEPVAERLGAESFGDSPYRAIFSGLTTHDADAPLDELTAAFDEETTAIVQELLNETGGLDRVQETVDASINALLARSIADRMMQIDRELSAVDAGQLDDLIREKQRLQVQEQALGRPRWKGFKSDRS